MEDAGGEGDKKRWFGKGGYHESSKMERGSWRNCCQSGVNPTTPIYWDKPGSKLDNDDIGLKQSEQGILAVGL